MSPKRFTWHYWCSVYDRLSCYGHSGSYNTSYHLMTWDEFAAQMIKSGSIIHSISEIRRVGDPHWMTFGVFERGTDSLMTFHPSRYYPERLTPWTGWQAYPARENARQINARSRDSS